MGRVLYFDIDGVLLDWNDKPKPALFAGRLQDRLRALRFSRLICVSGWADLVRADVLRIPADQWGAQIYRIVAPLFPDREWFIKRLELGRDTDRREQLIDPTLDWYYVDDNADQFFVARFGHEAYVAELGRRICLARHDSDGSEVIAWLNTIRD